MPCMNLVEPLENYMSPSQIREGYDATSGLSHWSQSRGNHGHCGDQSLIGLPLITPSFPPGTHDYDPNRHNLIEGIVSKSMITRQEAQAKFNEYHETQGSHDEVYTDGSKMNERVGAAAVINRHFLNGETTCRHLSKILPDNSTIFAAEATAIYYYLLLLHELLPVRGPSSPRCGGLLWLNVLLAGDRGRSNKLRTLLFAISWTSTGYWVTKARMFAAAGYRAIVE